jgi:hypothetical protein
MTLPGSIVANPNVNLSHHRIHESGFFSAHDIVTGLTIANPQLYLYITPSIAPIPSQTIIVHSVIQVSVSLGATFEVFEGTAVSADGTQVPLLNQDRNAQLLSISAMFKDPIVISEGTRIYAERIGSTITGGVGGPKVRDEDETMHKIGTKYLFKITPLVDGIMSSISFKGYRQGVV